VISRQVDNPIEVLELRGTEGKHRRLRHPTGYVYLAISLVLMAAKISLGIVSGSKALVVSAMLSMQDCVWAGIVLVRSKTTRRSASQKHPFGLGKVEFIVAGWMSLLVLVGVAVLCGTIAHSLLEHRQRAPGILAMWVALVSAAVCLAVSRQSRRSTKRTDNSALDSYADLIRADAFASVVVAGSVIVARMGFELIDSVVAAGEALFVVWCAARLLHGSVRGLLDASVGLEKIAEIEAAVRETDGVFDVCSVRAVQSGQEVLATVVVDLPDAMTIAEADEVRWRIGALLRRRLDEVGQVLVGFRTRDEHRHAHRIKHERTAKKVGATVGNEEP
jgi:cation diffusion facilitator family transporter